MKRKSEPVSPPQEPSPSPELNAPPPVKARSPPSEAVETEPPITSQPLPVMPAPRNYIPPFVPCPLPHPHSHPLPILPTPQSNPLAALLGEPAPSHGLQRASEMMSRISVPRIGYRFTSFHISNLLNTISLLCTVELTTATASNCAAPAIATILSQCRATMFETLVDRSRVAKQLFFTGSHPTLFPAGHSLFIFSNSERHDPSSEITLQVGNAAVQRPRFNVITPFQLSLVINY